MKAIKNFINEKKQPTINMAPGSIGHALLHHRDELNKIKSNEELIRFMDDVISLEIEDDFQEDYQDVMDQILHQKSFMRNYRYIYNYILAGDNLRA